MAGTITAQYQLTFKDLASRGLFGVASAAQGVVGKLGAVTGAVAKLGGVFTGLAGAVFGSKLIQTQRQFDVLNASLLTATGSIEAAKKQFKELNDFAKETPYTLDQSVRGFIQLKNLGLDPSIKTMRAYGDFASAMSADLSQMIEAVADASTFEFERLKTFGIKTSQDAKNNSVTFTFQGKKTKIKRDAKSIQKYILAISKQFEGAMANRMATLDGSFANFGQNFENVVLKISQSGIGDAVASVLNKASAHLTKFFDYLDSEEGKKQIDGLVSSLKDAFEGLKSVVSPIIDYVGDKWGSLKTVLVPVVQSVRNGVATVVEYMKTLKTALDVGQASRSFWIFPTSIQLIVQAVDLAKEAFRVLVGWIQKLIAVGGQVYDWAVENKEILIALGSGIAVVAGYYAIFTGVMTAITTVTTLATAAMSAFGAVLAFITSPITIIVGLVALVAAGFVYLYRNNESFRNGVNAVWLLTKKAISYMVDAWEKLGGIIDRIVNAVFDGLGYLFTGFVNMIIDKVNMLIRMVNYVTSLIPGVGEKLQMTEFEKFTLEHKLTAEKTAETRAMVAKSLINMTVAITGKVDGASNVQANVTQDSYKSSGGNTSFVVKK